MPTSHRKQVMKYPFRARRCNMRNSHGQGIVEAMVSAILMAMLISGGTFLIFGAGLCAYYKIKISQSAESAARYLGETTVWLGAARPGYDASRQWNDAAEIANTTLADMGLPPASQVIVNASTVNNKQYYAVSVTVSGVSVLGWATLPPMTEIACAPVPNTSPLGVVGMTFLDSSGTPHGTYVPAYGAASAAMPGPVNAPLPAYRFPLWQGPVRTVGGVSGPFQNSSAGGPFTSY